MGGHQKRVRRRRVRRGWCRVVFDQRRPNAVGRAADRGICWKRQLWIGHTEGTTTLSPGAWRLFGRWIQGLPRGSAQWRQSLAGSLGKLRRLSRWEKFELTHFLRNVTPLINGVRLLLSSISFNAVEALQHLAHGGWVWRLPSFRWCWCLGLVVSAGWSGSVKLQTDVPHRPQTALETAPANGHFGWRTTMWMSVTAALRDVAVACDGRDVLLRMGHLEGLNPLGLSLSFLGPIPARRSALPVGKI